MPRQGEAAAAPRGWTLLDEKQVVCPIIRLPAQFEDYVQSLDKKELLAAIQQTGISGLGGATFPAHVKLNVPADTVIDTMVVNGAECEPFLTCDHRIVDGAPAARFVRRLVGGGRHGVVATALDQRGCTAAGMAWCV